MARRRSAGLRDPARRSTRCRRPPVSRRAAAVPARRLPLARLPAPARARRHPRRRHGPRQDRADARAHRARDRAVGCPATAVPRRRARPPSSRTGRPRPRASRPASESTTIGATEARAAGARRRRRRRRHRRHDATPSCGSTRRPSPRSTGPDSCSTRPSSSRTAPSKVHQAAREHPCAVPARRHRHADREQPHGAVGAVPDRRARACSRPPARSPRSTGGPSRTTTTSSASAGCAVASARSCCAARKELVATRAAAEAGAGALGRARPAAPAHLRHVPAARAAEAARAHRRPRSQPVHRVPLAHAAAHAEPRRRAHRSRDSTPTCRRPSSTPCSSSSTTSSPRATGRWCSASSRRSCSAPPARLDAAGVPYAYLDGSTRRRGEVIDRFRDGDGARVPHQPQGRRIRPQPHRGRLRVPARPVVEPRERGAGRRPRPPHRAGRRP